MARPGAAWVEGNPKGDVEANREVWNPMSDVGELVHPTGVVCGLGRS